MRQYRICERYNIVQEIFVKLPTYYQIEHSNTIKYISESIATIVCFNDCDGSCRNTSHLPYLWPSVIYLETNLCHGRILYGERPPGYNIRSENRESLNYRVSRDSFGPFSRPLPCISDSRTIHGLCVNP